MSNTRSERLHAEMVAALCKSDADIAADLNPGDLHLLHMAVGISGESGELLDAAKKYVIYRKPLDMENVIEEIGDIEFFIEGLRNYLGITREETLQHNINKLAKRYAAGKFSNEQAQIRADKE